MNIVYKKERKVNYSMKLDPIIINKIKELKLMNIDINFMISNFIEKLYEEKIKNI